MEKNSKDSLKNWVRKIRNYEYQLKHLYEKLEYLEMKSIGYNSPSFDPSINSNSSNGGNSIDYWLIKIDECKREIKNLKIEFDIYSNFIRKLDSFEKTIFIEYIYLNSPPRIIIQKLNISRSFFYHKVKSLKKKIEENLYLN